MASECSFAHGVSLPAHRPPLAFFTSCRMRHGAARGVAHHLIGSWWRRGRSRWAPSGGCSAQPGAVLERYVARILQKVCVSSRILPRYSLIRIPYGGARAAALRADEAEVAVPQSVPVRVAYELQHLYLDVRTEDEFSSGHPAGAVNVPYMYSTGSGMAKNPHFVEQVSAIFGNDDEIIIGFTAVTDIAGGFSTWRENGLPVNNNLS